MHPIFHISLLNKCIGYPTSVVPLESVGVKESLSYKEVSVEILDHQVWKLRNKEVAFVKVLWRNQLVAGDTWEAKTNMMSKYPIFFPLIQFQFEVQVPHIYSWIGYLMCLPWIIRKATIIHVS
ncbi:hypothetical protein MTR67_007622 [Solanum verrucosum]|uniref:Uncharacterized protein n=1 Tax=Solanum verrucosum TaxID=315347 RepID=A0AAF0Q0L4_SOLVR|nr:hypothetical protein MTR67_007622 [Solanum verrucosum]